MQPRTKRQREILSFITNFIEDHGYVPSYQQIARHLGVNSKGGIAKHIEALEKQGLLLRNYENGSFNLEINPQKTVNEYVHEIEWLEEPVLTDDSKKENRLYVPQFMLGYLSPTNVRALQVKDNALLKKNIMEDDIALIEIKTFARDGECVAALVDGQMLMLRLFYRMGADIDLAPANDNFEIASYPADKVTILGIYRGLIRPFF